MPEDRVLRAFRRFDVPLDPDPAFAEALYGQLVAELAVATRPGPGGRLRRFALRTAAASRPWEAPWAWQPVAVVVAAGLLAAALLGALLVAGWLSRPDPLALVERSRAVTAHPPPFAMTIRSPDGQRWRVASDGSGTWRIDDLGMNPGAYTLFDGTRTGWYEPSLREWLVGPAAPGMPPFPLNGELSWVRWDNDADPPGFEPVPCPDAAWLDRGAVASREADHVRCPAADLDYWIDTETGLVLRMEAGEGAPGWDGASEGMVPVIEALVLASGPPDPADFAWEGPPGSFAEGEMPPSFLLEAGAPAPPLEATTIDGRPVRIGPGRPSAVLFTARGAGTSTRQAFDAASPTAPGVHSVVIQVSPPGTVEGYAALHPTVADVVADPEASLAESWGLNSGSVLVLLNPDGTVRGLFEEPIGEGDMRALFAALVAGDPLPEPVPPPASTPWPMPSELIGEVSSHARGAVLEPWSAPLFGGGTLDGASLRGRLAVLWFWSPDSGLPWEEDLARFTRLVDGLGDQAAFVIVASGEPTPGWVADTLARHGLDVPVAFDWDGRLGTVFRAGTDGTFVLDADGHLADAVAGVPIKVALRRILDRLEP